MRAFIDIVCEAAKPFNIDDVVVKETDRGCFDATWNGVLVGRMLLNSPDPSNRVRQGELAAPGERTVFKVATNASFRKRGVARKIYDFVNAKLAKDGERLVPSSALHDDGYEFWKRYDSSQVKRDGRVLNDQYLGKVIDYVGRHEKYHGQQCTIHHCGFKSFGITFSNGNTASMAASDVFAQLGEPDLPEWAR